MAFESVQIVSTRNGSSSNTGTYREDLLQAEVVGLSLSSMVGVTSVLWEIIGRPELSAAGGAGPEPVALGVSPTASFTVDSDAGAVHKDGTYLVRATINPGSPGQVRKTCALARVSGITIAGASGARTLRKPGGFEGLEDTSTATCRQGYGKVENRWFELLRSVATGGGVIETLAGAYSVGGGASDQTLLLNDGNGGGVVIDGSAGGFTGASALRVNTAAGGPFVVDRATGNLGIGTAAPAATVHAKAAAPALRLDRTGGVAFDVANVSDVLSIINRTSSTTLVTIPAAGGLRSDLGLSIGAAPATGPALVMGVGSTAGISISNTGRLRYNEVTQQWESSTNGGAYVAFGAGTGASFLMDGISTGSAQLASLTPPTTGAVEALVLTVRDVFYLNRTSTLTADGISVVTALGGGRWIRRRFADPFWITQTTWKVDPVGGNDENLGDASHALKTWSEYHRRLWGAQLPPGTDHTITIASSLNAGDDLQGFFNISRDGVSFAGYPHYVGTQIVLFSSTLDTVTNQNGATSQSLTVVCNSLGGTWSNSGTAGATLVGRTIRRTSDGSTARVVQDLGGKSAILSVPITPSAIMVQWNNGDAFTVYDVPSLGQQVSTHAGTTQFTDLKVTGRWNCQYGQIFQYNCEGDVVIDGDFGYSQNGLTGLISGASYLVSRGTGSIAGGYHRLIGAGGQIRINTTTTVKALQVEGESVITAINGGAQGTADIEFNQTGTMANLNPAINFLGISGGRIINSGYTYGSIGSSNTLVNFQGRGQRLDVAHVPTVTGGAGASQITTTQGGIGATNVSVLATRQWDDQAGNMAVGPAGTTLNDNRGQTILHVGSAAGVGTSAVNWNDVLGAVGGAALSLTQGSVPFGGVAGAITQDNANLFFDDTNFFLGVGTNAPTNRITVLRNQASVLSAIAVFNPSVSSTANNADFGVSNGGPGGPAGTAGAHFGVMGQNSAAYDGTHAPNLTASSAYLVSFANSQFYIGTQGALTIQTGNVQAERIRVLATGEVQLSSLSAGGLVKAAAGGQLGIAVGGTDFIAPPGGGLTAGSVVFGGASGNIAQDNADLFWDNTAKTLGIGTNTPTFSLSILRNANDSNTLLVTNPNAGATAGAAVAVSNGTAAGSIFMVGTGHPGGGSAPNAGPNMFVVSTTIPGPTPTLYLGSNGVITMQTGNTQAERLKIDISGNVSLSSLNAGGMVKAAATTGQLSIGVSGTDYLAPASALTTGSVLFAGAGGAVAQDNANLFWDDTNNRLGIGTSTPTTPIDVVQSVATLGPWVRIVNASAAAGPVSAEFGATNNSNAIRVGVMGTNSLAHTANAPNLIAGMTFLLAYSTAGMYIGSPNTISLQTGVTQAERVKVDASGNVFMSSLSAGGVVVADPTTGKLGIGSSGGGGAGTGLVNTGGAAAFSLGTLASGVLEHVVTLGISAPTSIAMVAGQVPFGSGTNGLLAQDANLFWDATNHRLGIGTNAPLNDVNVVRSSNGAIGYVITNPGTGTSTTAFFNAQSGTYGSATASMSMGMTGTNYVGTGIVANLGSNTAVITTITPGPSPTLYLGSHGVITMQTGPVTQAERVRILATGEVRLSSLAAGGLVKAAGTTGQLGIGLVTTTDITDLNVTMGKLEPIGPSKILGNDGPATQSPFDISVIAPLTMVPGNGQLTFATGFLPGSIIFQGASQIAQDNANLFWDDTNNRLGVGTNAPIYPIEVAVGAAATGRRGYRALTSSTATDATVQFWATNVSRGIVAGVTGTSFVPIGAVPNLGASQPYLTSSGASGATLYIGSDTAITMQTGATQAERLKIDVSGNVSLSSLNAGGVVTAAATTGQLGVVSFVAGEIPFGAASGGGLSQDSTLVWDNTNKRLGLGASIGAPQFDVHVVRSTGSSFATVAVESSSHGTTNGALYLARNSGGTVALFGATGDGYTSVAGTPNLGANTAFLNTNNGLPLYIGAITDITFQTGVSAQAERMRVLSTGEVVIRNKLVGGTTGGNSLVLQGTTDVVHTGNVTCVDPLGVGRSPGVIGGGPMFAVAGNIAVTSGAFATLGYIVMNQSTVNVSGATNITNPYGFNCVDLEPHVYSTSVIIGAGGSTPAAATLCIHGAPTITGGGSFAGGVGAIGLWVKSAGAVIEGNLRLPGGSIIADGSLVAADLDVNTARNISSFFVGTLPAFAFQATMDVGPSNPRVGFFNTGPVLRPTVTGSRSGGTALANLLSLLGTGAGGLGLIQDSTTA